MKTVYQEIKKDLSTVCGVPIAGIRALTTIDFPGKLAAVLFTKGCPWQCRYCHNSSLRSCDPDDILSCESVEEFLTTRKDFLEGIVISGGEPTLHGTISDLLQWLRGFGYKTALHTNGYFPIMLRCLLKKGLLDYIAMDIKAPPGIYDRVTGGNNTSIAVARSIDIILSSGVDYEFRTTYHPLILSEQELMDTVHIVSRVGAKRYYLQQFRSQGVTDEVLTHDCTVATIPDSVREEAQKLFEEFEVR